MFTCSARGDPKASLWSPPDLCGMLEKQSRKHGSWKPRFFVLKGSNLFWFTGHHAKTPKGHIPLEGSTVHAVRAPAISGMSMAGSSIAIGSVPPGTEASNRGDRPAAFGIVILTDDAYAETAGGRSELVIAANTPELQGLWTKALQQAAIPRPQLLAKLHETSRLADSMSYAQASSPRYANASHSPFQANVPVSAQSSFINPSSVPSFVHNDHGNSAVAAGSGNGNGNPYAVSPSHLSAPAHALHGMVGMPHREDEQGMMEGYGPAGGAGLISSHPSGVMGRGGAGMNGSGMGGMMGPATPQQMQVLPRALSETSIYSNQAGMGMGAPMGQAHGQRPGTPPAAPGSVRGMPLDAADARSMTGSSMHSQPLHHHAHMGHQHNHQRDSFAFPSLREEASTMSAGPQPHPPPHMVSRTPSGMSSYMGPVTPHMHEGYEGGSAEVMMQRSASPMMPEYTSLSQVLPPGPPLQRQLSAPGSITGSDMYGPAGLTSFDSNGLDPYGTPTRRPTRRVLFTDGPDAAPPSRWSQDGSRPMSPHAYSDYGGPAAYPGAGNSQFAGPRGPGSQPLGRNTTPGPYGPYPSNGPGSGYFAPGAPRPDGDYDSEREDDESGDGATGRGRSGRGEQRGVCVGSSCYGPSRARRSDSPLEPPRDRRTGSSRGSRSASPTRGRRGSKSPLRQRAGEIIGTLRCLLPGGSAAGGSRGSGRKGRRGTGGTSPRSGTPRSTRTTRSTQHDITDSTRRRTIDLRAAAEDYAWQGARPSESPTSAGYAGNGPFDGPYDPEPARASPMPSVGGSLVNGGFAADWAAHGAADAVPAGAGHRSMSPPRAEDSRVCVTCRTPSARGKAPLSTAALRAYAASLEDGGVQGQAQYLRSLDQQHGEQQYAEQYMEQQYMQEQQDGYGSSYGNGDDGAGAMHPMDPAPRQQYQPQQHPPQQYQPQQHNNAAALAAVQQQIGQASALLRRHAQRLSSLEDGAESVASQQQQHPHHPHPQQQQQHQGGLSPEGSTASRRTRANTQFFISAFNDLQSSLVSVQELLAQLVVGQQQHRGTAAPAGARGPNGAAAAADPAQQMRLHRSLSSVQQQLMQLHSQRQVLEREEQQGLQQAMSAVTAAVSALQHTQKRQVMMVQGGSGSTFAKDGAAAAAAAAEGAAAGEAAFGGDEANSFAGFSSVTASEAMGPAWPSRATQPSTDSTNLRTGSVMSADGAPSSHSQMLVGLPPVMEGSEMRRMPPIPQSAGGSSMSSLSQPVAPVGVVPPRTPPRDGVPQQYSTHNNLTFSPHPQPQSRSDVRMASMDERDRGFSIGSIASSASAQAAKMAMQAANRGGNGQYYSQANMMQQQQQQQQHMVMQGQSMQQQYVQEQQQQQMARNSKQQRAPAAAAPLPRALSPACSQAPSIASSSSYHPAQSTAGSVAGSVRSNALAMQQQHSMASGSMAMQQQQARGVALGSNASGMGAAMSDRMSMQSSMAQQRSMTLPSGVSLGGESMRSQQHVYGSNGGAAEASRQASVAYSAAASAELQQHQQRVLQQQRSSRRVTRDDLGFAAAAAAAAGDAGLYADASASSLAPLPGAPAAATSAAQLPAPVGLGSVSSAASGGQQHQAAEGEVPQTKGVRAGSIRQAAQVLRNAVQQHQQQRIAAGSVSTIEFAPAVMNGGRVNVSDGGAAVSADGVVRIEATGSISAAAHEGAEGMEMKQRNLSNAGNTMTLPGAGNDTASMQQVPLPSGKQMRSATYSAAAVSVDSDDSWRTHMNDRRARYSSTDCY